MTIKDMKEILDILRELLSDLNYSSGDQMDHLRKKGYCLKCYKTVIKCNCKLN